MSPPPDDERTVVRPASARSGGGAGALGHHLPVGTRIRDYEITGLIGEGGFGIVYLAQDVNLERRVAVKEYMPSSMASRVGDSHTIVVKSERHRETFAAGLKSFINEARLLARFDHPALLKVYRFWEENGTAYMAMPYYEGPTLKSALAARPDPPDEAALRAWLRPLLDALSVMHAAQCFHRDIAPDNILLTATGPLLLDFGAARRVIGDMTHALTVVLKPGYAPVEQYGDVASMTQGAWTDLYALACVVYFAITGKVPMSSVERLMDDRLQPLSKVAAGRYSPRFLEAIDKALAVRPQDRPQTDAEFRAMLEEQAPVYHHPPPSDDEATRIIPQPRTQVPTRHGPTITPPTVLPAHAPTTWPQTAQPSHPQTTWPQTTQPPVSPPAAPTSGSGSVVVPRPGGRAVGAGALDSRPSAFDSGHGALDSGHGGWPGTQSGYHTSFPQTGYPPAPQPSPGTQEPADAWPGTTTGFPGTSHPVSARTSVPPAPAIAPPPATVEEQRPATAPGARPAQADAPPSPSRLPLVAGVAVGVIALAVAAYVWTGRGGTTTTDVTPAPAPPPGAASAVTVPPVVAPVPVPSPIAAPSPVAAPAPAPAPEPAPAPAPSPVAAPPPAPTPPPAAPAPAPAPREPMATTRGESQEPYAIPRTTRRERIPPMSEPSREPTGPPVAKPGRSTAVEARCSDILQKASLEQLTAEESSFLKRECR